MVFRISLFHAFAAKEKDLDGHMVSPDTSWKARASHTTASYSVKSCRFFHQSRK
jgi:hypothetical protein